MLWKRWKHLPARQLMHRVLQSRDRPFFDVVLATKVMVTHEDITDTLLVWSTDLAVNAILPKKWNCGEVNPVRMPGQTFHIKSGTLM